MREGNGFTLIELAVVIAIIGILAAVAVPRFVGLTKETELSISEKFLSTLQTSAALYVANNGIPPTEFRSFVTSGDTNPPYTVSTKMLIDSTAITSLAPANYGGTTLTLTTQSGYVTQYFLNGTDITAVFP